LGTKGKDKGKDKGKGKGKLLSLHVMKSYGGFELQTHSFLTSALGGGQRSI